MRVRKKVRLTLEQEGDQYPLTAEWRNAPGERRIAKCTAPESIPVGTLFHLGAYRYTGRPHHTLGLCT